MTGALAPDEIHADYEEGGLRYEEVLDVTDVPEEMVHGLAQRTAAGFEMLGTEPGDVEIDVTDDEVRIRYEVESPSDRAVAAVATELLLVLADRDESQVDRAYHLVKALGPQHIPLSDGLEDDH